MGDRTRGLYNKFSVRTNADGTVSVRRTDGSSEPGGKHDGCRYFVLDATHDPFAGAALRAYADACRGEYPALASDVAALAPVDPPDRKGDV